MKKLMLALTIIMSSSVMASESSMLCETYSLKDAQKLQSFKVDYNTDSGSAVVTVEDQVIKGSIVEVNNELVHIDITGVHDDDPHYSELKKTGEKSTVLISRVAREIIKQYNLDEINPLAASKLSPALQQAYGSLNINATFKMDGHYKYLMSCNKG